MLISLLANKLLFKSEKRVLLINAPENYPALLEPLPGRTQLFFEARGTFDIIQLFVLNKAELKQELELLQDHLHPDTILWITYPKKSSGIKSDLEMAISWDETSKYGLSGVASIAVNEIWTALRFRPNDQIRRSEVSNSAIKNNQLGDYIDIKNRKVMLPPGLKSKLQENPAAITFFESLSYSNKKEYVSWVLSAKQDKTKTERIAKAAEKLAAGKKNPAEK